MRQGSEGMWGVIGQRREGRQSSGSTSFMAACCNRLRFSSTTSRDHCGMRSDSETESCDVTGRMRSGARRENEYETPETAD
jgi:hypothetical protein